jgi:predicted RNA methylase
MSQELNAFSAIRLRSGLDIEATAAEFGAPAETVRLWETGELRAPDRVMRTLAILADFAPRLDAPHAPVATEEWPSNEGAAANNDQRDRKRKSSLGQFFTPRGIARFMAHLLDFSPFDEVRLLDAGAGSGALTSAAVEVWREARPKGTLKACAYEVDEAILPELHSVLTALDDDDVQTELIEGDFIALTARDVRTRVGQRYTHAILNPPYKKIGGASEHRALLRVAGLETVNLYSGFVALALELLQKGGQLVAIIPRSFCNGPYYQPFRRWVLQRAAIRQIHLFDSRNRAFKADGILQENVILFLKRGARQEDVVISRSADGGFSDFTSDAFPIDKIVFPNDPEQFIHIPTDGDAELLEASAFQYSLDKLGLEISTGPVVDFRLRDYLRADPERGAVPLLYPGHFKNGAVCWPRPGFKKANAIVRNATTEKWLFPNGYYVVVRRFSAKEEARRIVANVVDPNEIAGEAIGFENHLNVFHARRGPLQEFLAHGLSTYLNSTVVDQYFRRFNGHTQVNATDLRAMRYPSAKALRSLGEWAWSERPVRQAAIDAEVSKLL